MKQEEWKYAIQKYTEYLKKSVWIKDEAYKFEFSNFVYSNVDFNTQSNHEILDILHKSQSIKYDGTTGVQFIKKSARGKKSKMSEFITLNDIDLFHDFSKNNFSNIDWSKRSMSFTVLSAWLASLFPEKIYPIVKIGFDKTIEYLFEIKEEKFPKDGLDYIVKCQSYFKQTEIELRKVELEKLLLSHWNVFYKENEALKVKPKNNLEKIDWIWLVQDFHLFIEREILKTRNENKKCILKEDIEPQPEGKSKLAIHIRYERNSSLIKAIKLNALVENPKLNCAVCQFSFFDTYGELGAGFIEAHHKKPLYESKKTITTEKDIALVCSNCHKMLHRSKSTYNKGTIMTIEELKEIIENTKCQT